MCRGTEIAVMQGPGWNGRTCGVLLPPPSGRPPQGPPDCEVRGDRHRREGPEYRRPPYAFPLKRFNVLFFPLNYIFKYFFRTGPPGVNSAHLFD